MLNWQLPSYVQTGQTNTTSFLAAGTANQVNTDTYIHSCSQHTIKTTQAGTAMSLKHPIMQHEDTTNQYNCSPHQAIQHQAGTAQGMSILVSVSSCSPISAAGWDLGTTTRITNLGSYCSQKLPHSLHHGTQPAPTAFARCATPLLRWRSQTRRRA